MFATMRFTTLSSILSLLCFFETSRADLNLLQKRFDIVGPEFVYDNWEFSLDFEVSDFITDNMSGYSLYDGRNCRYGDAMNSGDNDITNNKSYLLSRFRSDNVPEGNGSGTRMIKIQTQVVPSKLVNSGIYREGGEAENGDGIVEYCVRFSNYNMDKDDPQAVEVNYLETIVKVSIRFTGEFGVTAYVDKSDVEEEELIEGVALEAYLCDREENIVPVAEFNQGQTVRVCVTPTAEVLARGFRMRQIEDFVYRRELPFSTRQQAITAGTGGAPSDPLTVVSCRPGSVVCAFETLLFADFFVSEGVIAGE